MRRIGFAALVILAGSSSAFAQGYSQDQERYCTGDAMRLCSQEIPNVERITACMEYYRAYLSPPCKAVFGPPPAADMQSMRNRQPPRKTQQ